MRAHGPELMVGGSLSDAMRMHRTFTLRRAMEVAVDTARGLAYLHAKKNGAIIHRRARCSLSQGMRVLTEVQVSFAWHVLPKRHPAAQCM